MLLRERDRPRLHLLLLWLLKIIQVLWLERLFTFFYRYPKRLSDLEEELELRDLLEEWDHPLERDRWLDADRHFLDRGFFGDRACDVLLFFPTEGDFSSLELSWFLGLWLSLAVLRTSSNRDPGRTLLLLLISIRTPCLLEASFSGFFTDFIVTGAEFTLCSAAIPFKGFHFRIIPAPRGFTASSCFPTAVVTEVVLCSLLSN